MATCWLVLLLCVELISGVRIWRLCPIAIQTNWNLFMIVSNKTNKKRRRKMKNVTHRPCEIKWELNGINEIRNLAERCQIHGIFAHNRCHDIAKCARRWRIDVRLIMFQANAKSRFTRSTALVCRRIGFPTAANAIFVLSIVILKVF